MTHRAPVCAAKESRSENIVRPSLSPATAMVSLMVTAFLWWKQHKEQVGTGEKGNGRSQYYYATSTFNHQALFLSYLAHDFHFFATFGHFNQIFGKK